MKNKKRQRAGFILIGISIMLLSVYGLFVHLSLTESFVKHHLQRSVIKMDKEMQQLIDKGLNHEALSQSQPA